MDNRFKPDLLKPDSPRPASPTRDAFLDLPLLNRWLLASGAALLALGFLLSAGPPVASGVTAAIHPHTAQGKEELCLENLRLIGQAMQSYREENENCFPPLERTGEIDKGGNEKDAQDTPVRTTWVSLLRNRVSPNRLSCPENAGAGDSLTTSGYGFNAALAEINQNALAHPEQVVVLADRGDRHDLALLPPLEGWQANAAPDAKMKTDEKVSEPSSLDFRHGDRVGLLFADGHVEMRGNGDWIANLQSWGGAVAVEQAREHLLQLHPLLQQIKAVQDKSGDEAALTFFRQTAGKSKDFEKAMQAVWGLWAQNDSGADDGASFDLGTDKWGWRLAKAANEIGQPDFLKFFDQEQSRRSDKIWQDAKKGDEDNTWSLIRGKGFMLSVPKEWTTDEEQEGRYHRTFFRSPSPHIGILVERGERVKPGPEAGIQWDGTEQEMKQQYGAGYKRIAMDETTLMGETASGWEFEIDPKDAPKLRKIYIGRSHIWDSLVITFMAPAKDFKKWRPLFTEIKDGLQRG